MPNIIDMDFHPNKHKKLPSIIHVYSIKLHDWGNKNEKILKLHFSFLLFKEYKKINLQWRKKYELLDD